MHGATEDGRGGEGDGSLLWRTGPIEDSGAWAAATARLLELEREEERKEVAGLLTGMTAAEAQTAGLSLVGLRVLGRAGALFGRTKLTVTAPGASRRRRRFTAPRGLPPLPPTGLRP